VFFNYHLALALAQLGEAGEALAVADKAILQAGEGFRLAARLRKVWVLRALGRYDDAAALGRKLLDEFDAPADRLEIRYALAGALWGAKKYAEAERELRAILDADPDHAGACNELGYYLADQGRDLDEAERLIRRAVAVDRADRRRAADPEPNTAAYLDSLGWVLFRRGKLAEARDWLEKAAALPDGAADPTVWDHLGDVCFRLGDRAKAKAHWEQALTLYESDPRGREDGRPDEVRRKLKRVP
jgi:tetratricopeptide (TPR) repeat protein